MGANTLNYLVQFLDWIRGIGIVLFAIRAYMNISKHTFGESPLKEVFTVNGKLLALFVVFVAMTSYTGWLKLFI